MKVEASTADHKAIFASLSLPKPVASSISRDVLILRKANWSALEKKLQAMDWQPLARGTAEDSLHYFMEILLGCLQKYIPYKTISQERKSHPWLNDKCAKAVSEKRRCEGTDQFDEAQSKCAKVLADEYQKYVAELKKKIAGLSKNSKQWWRLNGELLNKKAQITSVLSLKFGEEWLSDSKSKANAFAHTFSGKSQLPSEKVDTPFFGFLTFV